MQIPRAVWSFRGPCAFGRPKSDVDPTPLYITPVRRAVDDFEDAVRDGRWARDGFSAFQVESLAVFCKILRML